MSPGVDPAAAAQAQALLAPLDERYHRWMAGHLDDVYEPAGEVRAQPLVVHLEKADPPGRTAALEAAATAALSVFFDPRAAPGGPWADELSAWVGGRIRKVARRARGTYWQAASDLPGVTVSVGGAEVRAFPPCRVTELPKELSRLQVSGTDLVDTSEPGEPAPGVPVLWLPPDLAMTAGKAMAQVGHATMLLAAFLDLPTLTHWAEAGLPVAVRQASAGAWAAAGDPGVDPAALWETSRRAAVRDAGFTEVEPGTITVVADGSPLS